MALLWGYKLAHHSVLLMAVPWAVLTAQLKAGPTAFETAGQRADWRAVQKAAPSVDLLADQMVSRKASQMAVPTAVLLVVR